MKGTRSWIVAAALLLSLLPFGAGARPLAQGAQSEYVVLYGEGVSVEAAHAAVTAAGGTVVSENAAVGVATVVSSNAGFLSAVAEQTALAGAITNTPVGKVDPLRRAERDDVEREGRGESGRGGASGGRGEGQRGKLAPEPLAQLQWDMAMIGATADGSYKHQPGDRRVIVAIIDSGIDGSHPDLAPNFNKALSRNFVTDIPLIDGPCEDPTDCIDPVDVDDNGHGSHVAGTIGAALNGLGIAGVAPNVTLVNARAGQDGGFLFLKPVIDAIVYSADIGADVVNMSFYTDPWLYNCATNPADSPEAQAEQRMIIEAHQRAVRYAHRKGVTLIGSAGNEHTDLGHPTFDPTSPDFPPGSAYDRTVDNSCLVLPTEAEHVISVSALGPSKAKADYSNYGVEQVQVSAPGGYFRDFPGTPQNRTVGNLILSTYPKALAELNGDLNPDGSPNNDFVVRDCQKGVCAYYQYLQGTSMASPHAAGVAALIVSEYGRRDRHRGLALNPNKTERILERSAVATPCPEPRLFSYANVQRPPEFDALCEGDVEFNGFYGHGIVNALRAVRYGEGEDD